MKHEARSTKYQTNQKFEFFNFKTFGLFRISDLRFGILPSRAARGYFTLLVLVFASVFFVLLSALTGYVFVEKRAQVVQESREKAFHIAEAGLEYYRWHLAHWPTDLEDGTGNPGPYVHTVPDPEGGTLGTFSLGINGDMACGAVTSVAITSTGWAADNPNYKRTVFARYTRPSVADYSAVINSNVWAGGDRVISGPYHSNGGIRMDGTHNAEVTSGVATWLCTSSFGCSNQNQAGVFGAGGPQSLWQFPVPPVDFNGISVDLAKLKDYATSTGHYLAPSGNYGYRIVLNADGSFDAYRVTGTTQIWGYTIENGWQQERTIISSTAAPTHYTLSPDCPVIFAEDNVWLEGTVSGKVTLAAADVTQTSVDRSIVISDDITYADTNSGLTAIGEQDVLVSLQSPDTMTINGIFIAQKGHFGRNHYCQDDCAGIGGNGNTGFQVGASTPASAGWSNFTASRLNSSNNQKATCDATCDNADTAQLSDFSFSIPSGASISGIEVRAEMAEGVSTGSIPTEFSLSWNGGANFTSAKSVNVNGTTDADYTFGGSSDTWGRTWSEEEFTNASFRLRIDKIPDSDTLSIDYVRVRVYYTTGSGLPSNLDQYVLRSTLTTNGTIVSNGRFGTKWTSGGNFVSGYSQRYDSYDRELAKNPPPFTPQTSDDFTFVEWREQ